MRRGLPTVTTVMQRVVACEGTKRLRSRLIATVVTVVMTVTIVTETLNAILKMGVRWESRAAEPYRTRTTDGAQGS